MSSPQPAYDNAPIVPEWSLGDRIRKARESAGMEQKHVAEEMGVSAGSVSKWEGNQRKPSIDTIRKLSRFTNVDILWLLGINDVGDVDHTGDDVDSTGYV